MNVTLQVSHDGLVQLEPNVLEFGPNMNLANITIFAQSAGHVEITASATPDDAIEYEQINLNILK